METTTPLWGPVTFSLISSPEHILSTNPGLYFAFNLRDRTNPDTKRGNSFGFGFECQNIEPTAETRQENNIIDLLLDESHQCRIYEYLCISGKERDFVDIANILPKNKNLNLPNPKYKRSDISYVAPCGMLHNSHLFSRRNSRIPKPRLHINNSSNFLDYRKRGRMRCQPRGPRRFANILNINNVWG